MGWTFIAATFDADNLVGIQVLDPVQRSTAPNHERMARVIADAMEQAGTRLPVTPGLRSTVAFWHQEV